MWKSLGDDIAFLEDLEAGEPYPLHRELVDQLPVILGGVLDETVSLKSLWQTRLAFARHLEVSQTIPKLLEVHSQLVFGESVGQDDVEMAGINLEEAIMVLEGLLDSGDTETFLMSRGVSEGEFLFDPKLGNSLDESLWKPYLRGQLTIRQLLMVQPMVLFSLASPEYRGRRYDGFEAAGLADDEDNLDPPF